MNCFPCFQKKSSNNDNNYNLPVAQIKVSPSPPPPVFVNKHAPTTDARNKAEASNTKDGDTTAKAFTFRELAMATKNFRQECLLGEGGFGRVFRGTLKSSGQIVAVRQLDRSGTQGSKEFQAEILKLSLLEHPNLVHIIGYCADGDQRLLVNEYMPSGSLKNHLFDNPPNRKPLDWSLRMKIAAGIAEGLEYLHEKVNPPIIYRDLKSSNILLDETNKPRLSEYGLAKLVQSGNKMHVTAYGYCAPEYERHGELTLKSDVYSFGVVLLELITGRKALETTRPMEEQNLVSWAQPIFGDPKRFPDMADPHLKKKFPATSLNQAVGVAAMCLQEEPMVRPLIGDIVAALSFLSMAPPEASIPDRLLSILSFSSRASVDVGNMSRPKKESISHNEHKHQKNHPKEHKNYEQEFDCSSDSDSSVRSRLEERHGVEESGKWGSGSKHCSNRSSSSIGSQDLSDCDSNSSSDEEFSRHGKSRDRQMTINSRTNSWKKSSGSY